MKYKLIHNQTKEEHLCDKVTIGEFDYYMSDEKILTGDYKYHHVTGLRKAFVDGNYTNQKKVIATTNPNIDAPKVIDEIWINKEKNQELIDLINHTLPTEQLTLNQEALIYHHGKSQETHPFSEEDMIEFAKWLDDNMQQREYYPMSSMNYKELLQLWKEQQPKTLYYE